MKDMKIGDIRVSLAIIQFLGLILQSMFCYNNMDAQASAGSDAIIETRSLIDIPTAGIIPHGSFALDMDVYENGGLLVGTSVGLFNRLTVGISFGGTGILGTDKPAWNNIPGFAARLRLIDETVFIPAIALGFDSQGKEAYIDELSRYTIKSLGFYAVASKNYDALGDLALHGGVNYSLERADGDTDPNIFIGTEKTIGPIASVLAEYNLGANDSNHDARGRGRGYLNVGFRMSVGKGFTVSFDIKDLFKNQHDQSIGNRTLSLEYVKIP
jgi:hypothetical protein